MNNPSIVFLYSRIAGYVEGLLQALLNARADLDLHLVYWNQIQGHPFEVKSQERLHVYKRTDMSRPDISALLQQAQPAIIYIVGWMDKDYLAAVTAYKKQHPAVRVVVGIDDQWKGTLRQQVGRWVFRFYLKNIFDYLWVAGKPQYLYARKMGYDNSRIIHNLLSANTYIFNKKASFSKRIVFVGRFSIEKGISNLIAVHKRLPEAIRASWPLVLIGDGPLRAEIQAQQDAYLQLLPYLQPVDLQEELQKGGVFCLPSNLFEMWGVVIHEQAILGYPLLLSSLCGATTEFLIEDYNGYAFDPNNLEDFYASMWRMVHLPDEQLALFSERSHLLGQRITVEMSAASLLSVLGI